MAPPRSDVSFESGEDHCAAWLYRPAGDGPVPLLVMAHGLGAVRDMRLDVYAERFRAAGYACLVFDYRHFGASGGEPRQLLDVGLQLEDWAAAVACARTLDGVDPERIVVWGTSFSGGHVIVTAAADPRIAAMVAQCPFTDGVASVLAMDRLTSLKLSARAIADVAGARAGRPPLMVATSGPPGTTALMTAPDAEPGYLALVPSVAPKFRNEVAARIAIGITLHRPGRRTKDVRCPALFCVCDGDSVAPSGPTLKYAARAPRGEVRRYPEGHFEIYVGEPFERVIADQLDFLGRHVPARTPAVPVSA